MIYTTIPKKAYHGQLTTSAAMLYTVPSSSMGPAYKAILSEILLVNNDTGTLSYSFHIVPAGGSASASNIVWNGSLTAGEAQRKQFGTLLEQAEFIAGLAATAAKITARITVAELLQS